MDAWRRKRRLSAHGLAELLQRTSAELQRVVEELCDPNVQPTNSDEVLSDKALCTGIVLELAAAKASLDDVYTGAHQRLEGRLSTNPNDLPVLTAAEAREARRRRAVMAEFSTRELEASDAVAYMRNELDGANERGAPPAAVKQLRKKGA